MSNSNVNVTKLPKSQRTMQYCATRQEANSAANVCPFCGSTRITQVYPTKATVINGVHVKRDCFKCGNTNCEAEWEGMWYAE